MAVREIRGFIQAAPLPQSPSFVRGLIAVEGKTVSLLVLDGLLAGERRLEAA
jgi:chemotaxis signal transduction protein